VVVSNGLPADGLVRRAASVSVPRQAVLAVVRPRRVDEAADRDRQQVAVALRPCLRPDLARAKPDRAAEQVIDLRPYGDPDVAAADENAVGQVHRVAGVA
jgi:hypothetical protein